MAINIVSKSQIRWQCRRGMLELDIMLISFFDHHYDTLSPKEQELFVALLEASDADLYAWLLGEEIPDCKLQAMVMCIRAFTR